MKKISGTNLNPILKFTKVALIILLTLGTIVIVIISMNISFHITDIKHIKTKSSYIKLWKLDQSIAEYKIDLQAYPDSLSDLIINSHNKWKGPYIKEKDLKDPWGNFYFYQNFPNRNGYQLYTLGSDNKLGGNEQAYDQNSEGSLKFIALPN